MQAEFQTMEALISERCFLSVIILFCVIFSPRDCNAARLMGTTSDNSYSNKNNLTFNVLSYGAVGDGATDDTKVKSKFRV